MKSRALKEGVFAGAIGGVSEVLFIGFYALIAAKNGWLIAETVTGTFFSANISQGVFGVFLGILIHMVLSLAVGIAFVMTVRRIRRDMLLYIAAGLSILLVIWALNFYILLPMINDKFIVMVPAGVAFFSKGLFGISMAFFHSRRL